MKKPQDDHLYWAAEASKYDTHAQRREFLESCGFTNKQRIDLILHLSVSFLPKRMHNLPNKVIADAWHDLPDNTKKTMFAVGIKGYRKK
tara:strand:- start:597 stop:863 length:267 start_codon:yes stop_codon:yes gene_type:complete